MMFSILILLLLAGITFIHFVQGMFSATLSAILTIIAATVAVSFHEDVIQLMKPGKVADSATAIVLCVLFVVTYVILRVIFDKFAPGNVRFQSTLDKLGGAVMGIIAGVYATGIISIAAQTMSFGPSVLGYSRYALIDPNPREVTFTAKPEQSQMVRKVEDAMKAKSFKEAGDPQKTWVPVDDIVLGTVANLSDGALSGARSFSSIHPDFLQEAFGLRAGMEPGAKRVATNFGSQRSIDVTKIIARDRLKQVLDAELPEVRGGATDKKAPPPPANENAKLKDEAKVAPKDLEAPKNGALLIVRMTASAEAKDKDGNFRFSLSAIRLVAPNGAGKAREFHPVGTFDTWSGGTVWLSAVSDPLFANKEGVDLVFVIDDASDVLEPSGGGKPKSGAAASGQTFQVKPGVFLEVKWLARVNLSEKPAERGPSPADPNFDILRKLRLKLPPPEPVQP